MTDDCRTKLGMLPTYMQRGMINYIERGIPTGDFLKAVLSNDLMDAFGRADSTNAKCLDNYAKYLYNYAPQDCHGSPEKYQAWVERGGLFGKEEKESAA